MSIITRILDHSSSKPLHVAIQEKDVSITYEQLASDIRRVSNSMKLTVGVGEFVIIHASNSYEFILTYFSVHYTGAKAVIIASDSEKNYKEFVVNTVKPKLVVCDCKSYVNNIVQSNESNACLAQESEHADLMFTSGTTGEPKGVPLTHAQLTAATEHIVEQVGNTGNDVELLLMPLSHSFGMARMRSTLFVGGTLVIGYPLQRLKGVFKAIEEHSVTGFGIVPSAWSFITQMSKDMIAKYASRLRYIELGSAYLAPEEKRRLTEWFPDTNIVMHYGLTEVSRAIFTCFHTDDLEAIGKVSRGAKFIIIKEDGSKAEEGEEGEIAFLAPWMASEYYNNPLLTSKSYFEGYLLTGDLGKYQGEYLYLTGRLKEVINVGGKKVSPYQVEDVLNQCDGILESACIPFSDKNMGEVVQAYVVLEPENTAEFSEIVGNLKQYAAEHLPVHMRPQKFHKINSLPKTPLGKLQRLKLASM
ncbi:AMP-binding protein [Vibrio aquimaris]|uniref:Putative sulfoacetate--CoA ligase n=1 Tax=Vibrio aquimaris TaxID=2587862 RepID=A0A5P9CH24_9VIBR|nr:AMP-binding protein [Vibrio aquimaris]QFT24862.1 putative sulfoacetate--CoA ligase [Vibrio aquimaris]